jgi:hypothetical protein
MVEPLSPAVRAQMLMNGTEEEVAEYESLLAEPFDTDPSKTIPDEQRVIRRAHQERLRALGEKLFRPR